MEKIKKLILISALLINSNAFSQNQDNKKLSRWSVEFMAGANNAKLNVKYKTPPSNSFKFPISPQFKSVFSHFANITFAYKINEWLGVSAGASSLSYGFNIDYYLSGTSGSQLYYFKDRIKSYVIQTPVQFKINPFSKIPFYINAGAYMAFNYSNRAYNLIIQEEAVTYFELKDDFGFIVGLGYDWFTHKKFSLGNQVNYYRGFNKLTENPFYTTKADGVSVMFKSSYHF